MNRLKKRHLNLFTFAIEELYHYRLFKISVSYRHQPAPSQLIGFSTTQALTERYFRADYNIIYTRKT